MKRTKSKEIINKKLTKTKKKTPHFVLLLYCFVLLVESRHGKLHAPCGGLFHRHFVLFQASKIGIFWKKQKKNEDFALKAVQLFSTAGQKKLKKVRVSGANYILTNVKLQNNNNFTLYRI